MNEKIILDVDQPIELMNTGIRRAVGFMSVALKSLDSHTMVPPNLEGGFSFKFFREDMNIKQLDEVKEEYISWIISNGFRELEQFFAKCLDKFFIIVSAINLYEGKSSSCGYKAYEQNTNIKSKLEILYQNLGSQADNLENFFSITKARNCLAHNLGFVTSKYVTHAEGLNLKWLGLRLFAKLENGKEVDMPYEAPQIGPFEESGMLTLEIIIKEKKFALGEKIKLSKYDLCEICLSYSKEAEIIKDLIMKRVQDAGITIIPK